MGPLREVLFQHDQLNGITAFRNMLEASQQGTSKVTLGFLLILRLLIQGVLQAMRGGTEGVSQGVLLGTCYSDPGRIPQWQSL